MQNHADAQMTFFSLFCVDYEIHGEVLDWLMNYLGRTCPTMIRIHIIQATIKETMEKVKTSPIECGFDPQRNSYQPLKLVKIVVSIVNKMVLDLQNDDKLFEIPLPPTSPNASELTKLTQPPKYSVDAIKNVRRTMEDKHMIIDDFNAFFNTKVCFYSCDVISFWIKLCLLGYRADVLLRHLRWSFRFRCCLLC